MNINIRKGEISDIETVHSLVRELAIYEKAEHQHTATIEDYTTDFLEERFEILIAENAQKEVLGMAFYFWAYSTWRGKYVYLEDFIIKKEYRELGIGQLIFDELIKLCIIKKAKLLKWQVLDWNTPAVKFYEKNNAIIEKEWWNGKIMFCD